jgi:hypothetical protein
MADLVKSWPTGAGGLMMFVSLIGCSQSHQTTAIQHENVGEHAAPGDQRAQEQVPNSTTNRETAARAAPRSAVVPEQVTVGSVTLTLDDCFLSVTAPTKPLQSVALDLPSGCKFGERADGTVQVENTKQGKTILVVSSKPIAGRDGDCDTHVKAVVIGSGEARISSKTKDSYFCGSRGPFDDALFVVLAASAISPSR